MLIARPTAIAGALLAGLIGLHAQPSAQERKLVECDFTASAQGWLVSGDTGPAEPVFHLSGGSPGGHISHVDEALGETWYFRAPDSLLKQLAAAENGTLSYSLKQSTDDPGFLDDDVIIMGPAGRLSFRFGASPGTGWTPFSVKLTAAAGWRWNWNARASQEQIHRVLANPTTLEIRGEYHTGPDEGALDNVVLRSGGSVGLAQAHGNCAAYGRSAVRRCLGASGPLPARPQPSDRERPDRRDRPGDLGHPLQS